MPCDGENLFCLLVLIIGIFDKWRGSKRRKRPLVVDDLVGVGDPVVVVYVSWMWWFEVAFVFVTMLLVGLCCEQYVYGRMLRLSVDGELLGRWWS